MRATIVLHERETHVQFFDPDSDHFQVINHPSDWTHHNARTNAVELMLGMGMWLDNTYSETNELGELIECYFLTDRFNQIGA